MLNLKSLKTKKIEDIFILVIFFLIAVTITTIIVSCFHLNWKEISSILVGSTGIFGIIIKFYFDWNLKKSEIKLNKVFENKLNILRSFFEEFSILESKLNDTFPKVMSLGAKNEKIKEEWTEIHNIWIKARLKYRLLCMFLNNKEINALNELWKKLDEIDNALRSDNNSFYNIKKEFDENIPSLYLKFGEAVGLA